jgi:hypothetical protein
LGRWYRYRINFVLLHKEDEELNDTLAILGAIFAIGLLIVVASLLERRSKTKGNLFTMKPSPVPKQPKSSGVTNFPFELLEFPGAEAISGLKDLRQQGKKERFTPVLLGISEGMERWFTADSPTTEEIIEQASTINIQSWFSNRVKEDLDYYEIEFGEWPGQTLANNSIMAHLELPHLKKPKQSVFIAKIPTANSWEVPAYLRLGGWNECPLPEEQVAISRYWHQLYGADIAAITEDTVEYLVERPPSDKTSAEQLAREHFIYCPDIVFQGCETMSNLAATLMGGQVWYFWWD